MRSITTRFGMMLATAAIGPLLVYGIVSISSLLSGTRQSVIEGHLNVARTAANQVALYVGTSGKILQAVAADIERTGLEPWQQQRILKNYVLEFPELRELTVFDEQGRVTVTSRIGPPRIAAPTAAAVQPAGVVIAPFALDDDLLPTTTLAIPIAQFGRDKGWLVGELSLIEMWRMVDRIRIGRRGFAWIAANDGRLIAHGDPEGKRRIARGENETDHPLVRLAREPGADQDLAREFTNPAGDQVLAVAAPIAPLGWTLIVEQPTEEAYAAAKQLVNELFAVIALALVVTLAAGYLWGRSFIRPILRLIRGTRAIAEGKLDTRVAVAGGGEELEQLGTAFNRMADRLVELQEDVRKQERQAVFGRIAVGLVHDLSHPIQNVANSCRLIVKMRDDPEYREMFRRTVDREFGAIRRVLEGLRHLARPTPLERYPVDVNRSVADVVEAMQSNADIAGVTVQASPAAGALWIEGDLFALGRVYRNLIVNALQATAPGGRIVVSTEARGGSAVIRFADTGCGIPPERLAEIFDDFATTKRRGLGLGLAISKKIVEQMQGTIAVESAVGTGTTFELTFPAVERGTVVQQASGRTGAEVGA